MHKGIKGLPLVLLVLAAVAQGAVLVTDVAGKARVAGATGDLATLASIEDGKELALSEGARLVAVDLASGAEFALHGPGTFAVQPGGVSPLKGGRIERNDLPAARMPKTTVAGKQLSNATFVMRDIKRANVPTPQSPVRTQISTLNPVFKWAAVDGAVDYQLSIVGEDGATVHVARTQQPELALAGSLLDPGRRYQWRVEAIGPNQRIGDASAHFTVLPADAMKSLAESRDAAGSVFSRRVLYALQLQDAGAIDEARQVWRMLAAERPDDVQLKLLAK